MGGLGRLLWSATMTKRGRGASVHFAAFGDEVGVDERGSETERGECCAEYETRVEPVGVFVGQEQGQFVRRGAGGELGSLQGAGKGHGRRLGCTGNGGSCTRQTWLPP